jgi:hypothetical protein
LIEHDWSEVAETGLVKVRPRIRRPELTIVADLADDLARPAAPTDPQN